RSQPGAGGDGRAGMTQDLTGAIEALAARTRTMTPGEGVPAAPGMTPPTGEKKETTIPLNRIVKTLSTSAPSTETPRAPAAARRSTLRSAPEPTEVLPQPGQVAAARSLVDESVSSTRPFRLGAYEVFTRIAQGGMGSIYLCRRVGPWGFQ